MLIKGGIMENGVLREVVIDTSKQLVAFKFVHPKEVERHIKGLSALAQTDWNAPLVMAPKGTPQQVLRHFADNWPLQFYTGHPAPEGQLLGPNAQKILGDG